MQLTHVASKHSGLEKAVFQIEQALKRTQLGSDQIQNSEQSAELRYLLERSRDLLSAERSQKRDASGSNGRRHDGSVPSPQQSLGSYETPPSQTDSRDTATVSQAVDDDRQLNLDDAENPLQLLARTSELLSSIGVAGIGSAVGNLPPKSLPSRERAFGSDHDSNLPVFFGRFRPRLDVGPDLDPIELGLLTLAEAEHLFA